MIVKGWFRVRERNLVTISPKEKTMPSRSLKGKNSYGNWLNLQGDGG